VNRALRDASRPSRSASSRMNLGFCSSRSTKATRSSTSAWGNFALSAVSRRTRPSTSFACASTTPKGRESSPYLNPTEALHTWPTIQTTPRCRTPTKAGAASAATRSSSPRSWLPAAHRRQCWHTLSWRSNLTSGGTLGMPNDCHRRRHITQFRFSG
jgi:hypothetical protein